jgi:error-prone DNA polymerase
VADRLADLSPLLQDLGRHDGAFAGAMARADEVRRPGRDARVVEEQAIGLPRRDPSYPSRNFR